MVMCYRDQRCAVGFDALEQQIEDASFIIRIEVTGRFISQDQIRASNVQSSRARAKVAVVSSDPQPLVVIKGLHRVS